MPAGVSVCLWQYGRRLACSQAVRQWPAVLAFSACRVRPLPARPQPATLCPETLAKSLHLPPPALQIGRAQLLKDGNTKYGCPKGADFVDGDPLFAPISAQALGETKHNSVSVCVPPGRRTGVSGQMRSRKPVSPHRGSAAAAGGLPCHAHVCTCPVTLCPCSLLPPPVCRMW